MPAPDYANYVITGDGYRWGAERGVKLGSAVTITYSFATENSTHTPNLKGFTAFNPQQEAAARAALDYISSFTKIKFVEAKPGKGDIDFFNANLGAGAGGLAPNATWGTGGFDWATVVINNSPGWRMDNKSYVPGQISVADPGGTAYQNLIHELAHTLGIKHPHDRNAAGDPNSVMPSSMDNLTQSSMSYFDYAFSKVAISDSKGTHFGTLKPSTYGMSEIAALQYLYGVNTTSKGNKTFVFKPDQPVYMTISDNGPNNTIDVSALKGINTIYLIGGMFSDLSIKQNLPAGTITSGAYDGTRAIAIAYGANVANVIGGSGTDRVAGNDGVNNLYGKNGDDILRGAGGDDHLYGGNGADELDGGAGFDYARYDDANYGNLVISLANPTLNTGAAKGDTYINIEGIIGGSGNDKINGNSAANTLQGGAGNDILTGGAGADKLDGGTGIDTASYAGAAKGVVASLTKPSINTNDAKGDTYTSIENLTGSGYADTLTGNSAANTLDGGAGDDILIGGAGADKLVGGSGIDTASYAGATKGVVANLTKPSANTNDAKGDTYSSIENLAGSGYADTLIGNTGNNKLSGGLGSDILAGGSGKDVFIFDTKLGSTNIDTIDDFNVKDDVIWLDDDIFTKIGKVGDLASGAFYAGTAAHDGDDRIVYNKTTGALWYDADGDGKGAAVQFALLDKGLTMTAAHFDIIA